MCIYYLVNGFNSTKWKQKRTETKCGRITVVDWHIHFINIHTYIHIAYCILLLVYCLMYIKYRNYYPQFTSYTLIYYYCMYMLNRINRPMFDGLTDQHFGLLFMNPLCPFKGQIRVWLRKFKLLSEEMFPFWMELRG